ncbi:MAG: carbon-nitrogen hydrolase family protein [Candidatus Rokubacteria bacterium]|nr:carbon-nitrogen hydrolase family protein [Candidatus Rokubacteria bacterium]
MTMDSVRVGCVLPDSYFGEEEWRNAARAVEYVEEAAREGVKLLLFPEGYPGPATGPLDSPRYPFRPVEKLSGLAEKHGMWIFSGDIEPSEIPGAYRLNLKAISPRGRVEAIYHRRQPDTPPLNAYLYNGKGHLLPGDKTVVLDTEYGRVGLLICSELWVPELPRLVMLEGAEIVVAPIHGSHSRTCARSAETWRCIARARAAENDFYVLITRNLFVSGGFDYRPYAASGAMVAGPEEMVGNRVEPGVLVADLDMARLRYLRRRSFDVENHSVPPTEDAFRYIRTRPGQIWERRPEIYRPLCEPSPYSFNYLYWKENLDAWKRDYDRIYQGEYRAIEEGFGGPFAFLEK